MEQVDLKDLNVSQYLTRKHKHSGKAGCAAFPDTIPMRILLNTVLHLTDYPGDHGIHYEPVIQKSKFKADPMGTKQ